MACINENMTNRYQNILENVYRIKIPDEIREPSCRCDDKSENCCAHCQNEAMLIECAGSCCLGAICTNNRFQHRRYAAVSIKSTPPKGLGLVADEDINKNTFIMEYIGEVISENQWATRWQKYSNLVPSIHMSCAVEIITLMPR